jgi:phosphatidylglycerophosphate synthase
LSSPAQAASSEPVRRTTEIEELTNLYFIHPVASRLVPLAARMRLSPNALTLTGMAFGLLAAFAYYRYQNPRFAVLGFVLMIAWHIMDGADGQLARLTKSQSQFGKVLDGISDSVTFLAIYTALALALARQYGAQAYVLVLVSAVCHAIQSASYELQRQEYVRWMRGGSGSPSRGPPARGARTSAIARPFEFLDRLFYFGLSFPTADVTRKINASMSAALDRHPARAALIRERYSQIFAPLVRRWSILSANYRTLGIFICALLAVPQYYFWFEILGFSALLALLIANEYTCYRKLFMQLHSTELHSAAG